MTQKELRALARNTLAKVLKGEVSGDSYAASTAIQILHVPDRKGE